MPAYVNTGLNVAHADDMCAWPFAGLCPWKTGRALYPGGENMTLLQILQTIDGISGKRTQAARSPCQTGFAGRMADGENGHYYEC